MNWMHFVLKLPVIIDFKPKNSVQIVVPGVVLKIIKILQFLMEHYTQLIYQTNYTSKGNTSILIVFTNYHMLI